MNHAPENFVCPDLAEYTLQGSMFGKQTALQLAVSLSDDLIALYESGDPENILFVSNIVK